MSRTGILLEISKNNVLTYVWVERSTFNLFFAGSSITNTQGFEQIKRTLLRKETKPLPRIEATNILTNISINDPRITFVYKSLGLFPHVRLSHPSYGTFKPI